MIGLDADGDLKSSEVLQKLLCIYQYEVNIMIVDGLSYGAVVEYAASSNPLPSVPFPDWKH